MPAGPFQTVLRLERRNTKHGLVSVEGNLCGVPDTTRRRPVEVHSTANEVCILEQGAVIAVHPVIDGRGQRRIPAGHLTMPPQSTVRHLGRAWHQAGSVMSLVLPFSFYDAVGKRLADVAAA